MGRFGPRRGFPVRISLPASFCRRVSLHAHGKPATEEDLFRYNNGRFLVNEGYELAKRYSPFNVDELCRVVSSLPRMAAPIARIEKKEGGYNKALLMTAENGEMVLAKVPCRNIVPRGYGTASEVAVLKFVKDHSSTSVSEVLGWSADDTNPVGSEYILLEPCEGQQLTKVWENLAEHDRVKLIRNFAFLESKLAANEFPGYGALYLRNALPPPLKQPGRTIAVDETYCLGPMYHGSWPGGFAADPENYAVHSGPWKTLQDLGKDLVHQGITQVANYKTSYAGRGPHYGAPEEHYRVLETVMQVMPILAKADPIRRHAEPVLCHPDFHPGNIFVSNEDPTEIVGVIDWQFTGILPLFTQVRWPLFLAPPEGYQTGTSNPELAPEYGTEDQENHAEKGRKQELAMRAKCYEAALLKSHLESYLALTETDVAIRRLFTSCPFTYRDGVLLVRDSLVKIWQHWAHLGVPDECPYRFTSEEVARHEHQMSEYNDWLKLREHTHQLLKSNDGGWVTPEADFDKIQARHQALYQQFVKTKMQKGRSEEDAKKLWFFRDRG
ncbi:phosphotransferase family protein [Aspergillus clavatus NRRL 1]|uniref:Altered inheritance of mitochondria protein 9, mitochondrial n=1 Tax=Aspergillus clavatus (strain ATCC 1007 / CBS 513.65 / DSM 816 / NCTC 3887 / NRRL 1 / QM 1276 / 107) TaxID=344612 RepID=A1CU37_ASPCL|nr:uncharacterized protein ACLA_085190 [Aspergillus clavatus NRRL 1]EAW06824.1 conserved hypothetical protein [Aspergillus clavatus NRRL 1]